MRRPRAPQEIAAQYETAIQKIWASAEFGEFINRRSFDMVYLGSASFAEFMKADNEDNGAALKSMGAGWRIRTDADLSCSNYPKIGVKCPSSATMPYPNLMWRAFWFASGSSIT